MRCVAEYIFSTGKLEPALATCYNPGPVVGYVSLLKGIVNCLTMALLKETMWDASRHLSYRLRRQWRIVSCYTSEQGMGIEAVWTAWIV